MQTKPNTQTQLNKPHNTTQYNQQCTNKSQCNKPQDTHHI